MTIKRSSWTPSSTYLYLVCLVTLIMVIVASVNLTRAAVELIYPEPAHTWVAEPVPTTEGPIADEKRVAEQEQFQQRWAQRRAVLSLVTNGTLLLIAGPLYVVHWRRIRSGAAEEQA
jgi:hypothetical protein